MEKVNACVDKIKDAFKELLRASRDEAEMIGNVVLVTKLLDKALEDAFNEVEKEKNNG